MDKKEIRSHMSEIKKSLTADEIRRQSGEMSAHLLKMDAFADADTVFAFLSFNEEIDTGIILEKAFAAGKKVAVPRIGKKGMEFCYISSINDCVPGYMGIREPSADTQVSDGTEKNVFMIMPGLAFGKKGERIGYGAGYYDRYLAAHAGMNIIKAAVGYDFQLTDSLPSDEYDVLTDYVITPAGVFEVKNGTSEGKTK
ncbi:MAG: 5-formyltetrahydrofolate cyclo-ligase [Parasporobacterium sp.]|nr:5-formyltetrahydrofolate cyclo-ligase [Parasporobacterium sp.]